jgi:hypothetical protein
MARYKNMEIGDKVKVVDFMQRYTTYDTMFKLLNFKDKGYNSFTGGKNSEDYKGVEFTVFGKMKHEDDGRIMLVAIKAPDGFELLVGSKGLKRIKNAKI